MTTYTKVFGGDTIPPSGEAYSSITLSSDIQAVWPDNYSGGTPVTQLMEISATVGPWSLTLPPANEISTGRDFIVRNTGSNPFHIKDNGGSTLTTVTSGQVKYFYLTNNGTATGLWSVFTYGTGTSAADASALAGAGLVVDGSVLATLMDPVSYSSTHAIQLTERSKLLKSTGGSVTWTIPNPTGVNEGIYFIIVNAGTGTLTLDADTNGGTVDGQLSKQLQLGESLILVRGDDAADWITVGYGRSSDFQFTQLLVDVSTGGTSDITVTSVQAANKLWSFTGTASGDRNVVIPSIASIYFVKVGSIGTGNTLTFKTSGAGATFVVGAGEAYMLYCDGVNVYSAQTSSSPTSLALSDGTASAPALSFANDSDTGLFRSGSNSLGLSLENLSLKPVSDSSFIPNTEVELSPGYAPSGIDGDTSTILLWSSPNESSRTGLSLSCNGSYTVIRSLQFGGGPQRPLIISDNGNAGFLIDAVTGSIDVFGGNLYVINGGHKLGYGAGSGSAVTQTTSRTNGVTINAPSGAIILVSAAGTTSWTEFTVTNNMAGVTDSIIVNQRNGSNRYEIHVVEVSTGSFKLAFRTTGGTATESPTFNFVIIRGVQA